MKFLRSTSARSNPPSLLNIHVVLECIFYPEKRERIYESLELLFQGLNTDKAGELFYVFVKYLLSATDVNPREVEKRVKHLPKGEETVRTTAEVLRKEGYDKGYGKGVVLGEQHGKLEATQETLIDVAGERYGLLPSTRASKLALDSYPVFGPRENPLKSRCSGHKSGNLGGQKPSNEFERFWPFLDALLQYWKRKSNPLSPSRL